MIRKFRMGVALVLLVIFSGCSLNTAIHHVPKLVDANKPRKLVVFFDGTRNDERSRTNIAKLHHMITLQNRTDIAATYIKGVGTGPKVLGAALGWGMRRDVIEAYQFLAENHHSADDKIILFGFSRGAYTVRILAALLYVAGVDSHVKAMPPNERADYIFKIYNAYKDKEMTITQRREEVNRVIKNEVAQLKKKYKKIKEIHPDTFQPGKVQFMGIWDTVEALGWPDYEPNNGEPNTRYADQLCNIKYAAHAVSIDDDRARVFTPLLLNQKHFMKEICDKGNFLEDLNEVWFSGAHSDVGGGYTDTKIGGVSLNWMLSEMDKRNLDLLPKNSRVHGDYLDKTHDPEKLFFGLIYKKLNRNLSEITDNPEYVSPKDGLKPPLKIHQSALDRLCVKSPELFESFWFSEEKYKNCVTCNGDSGAISNSNSNCSEILEVEKEEGYLNSKVQQRGNYCDQNACPKAFGENYATTKSCNYQHHGILDRAKQRVQVKVLDSPEDPQELIFYADSRNDRTGVFLKGGLTYNITINESDVKDWFDCTSKASYDVGRNWYDSDGGKLISLLAKSFSYSVENGLMSLMGEVSGQHFLLGKIAKQGGTFTPDKDGELILRVNEPRFMDMVYKNNHGMLKLTISVAK